MPSEGRQMNKQKERLGGLVIPGFPPPKESTDKTHRASDTLS